jgi:hypothetical protein
VRDILLGLALIAGLAGCALHSFEKVSEGESLCPNLTLPGKRSDACLECVRVHCCDEASACVGDAVCSAGFETAITPLAEIPSEFDTSLGCMQQHCDDACAISFGCVDTDYIKVPAKTEGKATPYTVELTDFANATALTGIEARTCSVSSGSCGDMPGGIAVDTNGVASLTAYKDSDRSIATFDPDYVATPPSAGTYPPHIFHWSEPFFQTGASMMAHVFSGQAVADLVAYFVQQKSLSGPGDPATDAHIVFYMLNCLPFRLRDHASYPHAGIPDASISLVHSTSASAEPAAAYYSQEKGGYLPNTTSSLLGSGGAARVEPGAWTASTRIDIGEGKSPLDLEFQFVVPEGGVGVVQLYPPSK